MYYKLKTSFLEDTLNDVLSEDGFDILEMSQRDSDLDVSLTESINGGPQLPIDIIKLVEGQQVVDNCHENCNGFSNIQELPNSYALTNMSINNKTHILKEFEPVEALSINDKAWGPKVAMKPEIEERKEVPRKSLKPNFREKLFQNSSFSKRNPRKSLSKSQLRSSLCGSQNNLSESLNSDSKEVLPDLETILMQKAKEQQVASTIAPNPLLDTEKSKENIKTQIDVGWLNRNAAQNDCQTNETNITNKICKVRENNINSLTPIRKSVYGLSNLDVSKFQLTPMEPIPQSTTNEPSNEPTNNLIINMNIKKPGEVDFPETPLNQVKKCKIKSSKTQDSDSMVDDSEEEKESQEYRHIVKRRRVITSISPKPNISLSEESIVQRQDMKSVIRSDKVLNKNVSANSEKDDEDYVEENPNTKRKKAVGKRKTSTKPKIKKTTNSLAKEKITKTSTKAKKSRATTTRASKNSINNDKLIDKEAEAKPLNAEDLKYSLVLERGDITSVPRIKQTDLDKADNLAQQYINTVAPMPGTLTSSRPIPVTDAEVKRAAAKYKLEEKIATGKLNENFVTINIQKKTFVRGKKSVNYSNYKKKLWKHKKHIAALSGPNMDMGGCDGGTLKCFNCGQTGHFAQNCKIKGDSLLPITAGLEEDPSPFPTLEEAARMASLSAVAVHSRNLGKLPQATNVAIYNQIEEDASDEVKVTAVNSDNESYIEDNEENQLKECEEILMESNEELEDFDVDSAILETQKTISPIKNYVGSKIPVEFLQAAGIDPTNSNTINAAQFRGVCPLYDLNADGSVKEVTTDVLEVLRMFGHTSFRNGQDRAVMRILSGMSTLVTLSTGSGKSLCYQLPAYLYSKHKKSITLVISPLVSLMEDQVTGVPHFLRAYCLHTNQTPQQKLKIMKIIANGEIDVLLVSPEAVVSGERSTGFGAILRHLPPIAFACIDEAHCVSQWSHNFRPSYMMICKVLKKNLGVKCVLGLTATATLPTRMSIINHLGITDGERGIISDVPLPDNLILSVSKDDNRDSALLQLLLSKRFETCQSIIIYCTRRDECERISGYLRTCLQDRKVPDPTNEKKKRKRVNWHAEPYHAGMPASRRRTIQNAFMSNELRIVVATIAFGMGINKPDIRAIIHYNMPRNFESYVQEVGRAGRDNKISHCHLFLDANGCDQNELKRHIYANSLDRHVIRKLLQRIFVSCSCDKNIKDGVLKSASTGQDAETVDKLDVDASDFGREGKFGARHHLCPGHEIGFSIEKTVEALDIPEENISTLLCYMELDNRWCINVLSSGYIKAKVISYGGPKYLKYAAKECPPLAMAIAMEIKSGSFKENANIIEFSVVDVAAGIGWNSGVVKYQLKNLEWVQVNGCSKRSPITVSFYDLGFRIKAPGDFTVEEIDDALDTLYNRSVKQEQTQLIQLQYVFQGLSSVAYNTYVPCSNEIFSHDRSDQLKGIIRDYFRNDYLKNFKLDIDPPNVSNAELESDVVALINMYPENNFSGRNIARIFHGISSPNYPALMWYRCKYWRVHSKIEFNHIVQLANNIIVKRRT